MGRTEDSGRWCSAASRWHLASHTQTHVLVPPLATSIHLTLVWEYSPNGYGSPHSSQMDRDMTVSMGLSGRSQ